MPAVAGVIKPALARELPSCDPEVVQRLLPAPFAPKLHRDHAIVGICLIRLERIRPKGFPPILTISSENAAHRIAVTWTEPDGAKREGVFITRRDSNSWLNFHAGGRLFPGVHHRATFKVEDSRGHIHLEIAGRENGLRVEVSGDDAEFLPHDSLFESVRVASEYFEAGGVRLFARA